MPLALSPTTQQAFDRMATDLGRVFGARLVALLAYTHEAGVAFVSTVTADDLDALSSLVEPWHRDGLATPLIVTPEEFARSLDAFPLEYQSIFDRHALITGADPIGQSTIPAETLRRATEAQAKGHLIHLRQGWLEAAGHGDRLRALVGRSAGPFRALIAHVGRLSGAPVETTEDLIAVAVRTTGMPGDLVRELFSLESDRHAARHVAARLREYVAGAEQLWRFVDGWTT